MTVTRSSPAPRISFSEPTGLAIGDVQTLEPHEEREGERYDGGDVSGTDLMGASFLETVFDSVVMNETVLRGARFVDCALRASFATSLIAARSTWRRVRVENPRWGSAELFDSEIESTVLSGGKIDFLNLRGAKLTDVVIENAHITELDLGGVTASRVAIRGCRIGTIDLTRARCTALDLRSSSFSRVLGVSGMRGTIVSPEQLTELAPILADFVGIDVTDDGL